MRLALGSSATWIAKDVYSFSSGPWLGSEARELLGLMARSAEQPEYGWLSCRDSSSPGLLISSEEWRRPELLFSRGELPPMVAVGAEASGVSLTLLLLPMDGTVLAGALVDTMLVGTLDGIMPARVELTGNLDGAGLVSTLAPAGFELLGTLEGTVLTCAGLTGTLEVTVFTGFRLVGEGTEPVVTELTGTSVGTSPGQMGALAWSPAPPAGGKLVEEGEEAEGLTGGADAAGPGKRLALGVERARGWKETVGDTGPRGDVGLEIGPAPWVLPGSGLCSCS